MWAGLRSDVKPPATKIRKVKTQSFWQPWKENCLRELETYSGRESFWFEGKEEQVSGIKAEEIPKPEYAPTPSMVP